MSGAIFIPSDGPEDWQKFLAQPDKQWVSGFSARATAHSWEAQAGWPPEIAEILDQAFGTTSLLLAIPEHKTPLPGGRRASQSDVFALGRHTRGLVACAIEGKVNEPFGPTLDEQMANASPGKIERLEYLLGALGLEAAPGAIHYQLLHRSVSALLEAERFCAKDAAMIVHSFAQDHRWFDAFAAFVGLFGAEAQIGKAIEIRVPGECRLTVGWASGDARFLTA